MYVCMYVCMYVRLCVWMWNVAQGHSIRGELCVCEYVSMCVHVSVCGYYVCVKRSYLRWKKSKAESHKQKRLAWALCSGRPPQACAPCTLPFLLWACHTGQQPHWSRSLSSPPSLAPVPQSTRANTWPLEQGIYVGLARTVYAIFVYVYKHGI